MTVLMRARTSGYVSTACSRLRVKLAQGSPDPSSTILYGHGIKSKPSWYTPTQEAREEKVAFVRVSRLGVAEPEIRHSANSDLLRFSDMLPPPPRPRYTSPLILPGRKWTVCAPERM